ncbi:MAG: hypothetical protein MPJ53_03815 [Alphaproteobacteria bacterium]|nr:hypothetical protein [Alphaproteobacteria bacterium]
MSQIPDDLPESAVSVDDGGDGTASVSVDSSGLGPGAHVFWIVVSDPHNVERHPVAVEVR